jgi:hypothetical protein
MDEADKAKYLKVWTEATRAVDLYDQDDLENVVMEAMFNPRLEPDQGLRVKAATRTTSMPSWSRRAAAGSVTTGNSSSRSGTAHVRGSQ